MILWRGFSMATECLFKGEFGVVPKRDHEWKRSDFRLAVKAPPLSANFNQATEQVKKDNQ